LDTSLSLGCDIIPDAMAVERMRKITYIPEQVITLKIKIRVVVVV